MNDVPERLKHLRPQTIEVYRQRGFHNWRTDPYHSLLPPEQGLSGPIYTSVVFGFEKASDAADIFNGKEGYAYPRISCGTPPIHDLSKELLKLELGEDNPHIKDYDVLLTASGMAAITVTVLALADNSRSIVSSPYLYGGTYHLFKECLPRLGIECLMIDDPLDFGLWANGIHRAKQPTLLFAEDDANPMLIKLDNKAIAATAHHHGLLYVCDRTVGTPILEKPLAVENEFERTDIVIHSLSKNISGYSWGLGGAVIAKKGIIRQLKEKISDYIADKYFTVFGPVMDPRVADKMLVGIRSLEQRIAVKVRNAKAVSQWLRKQPRVVRVYGPGCDLMSFEIKGDLEDAQKMAESVKLCVFAPHLGDIQTLIIHPASTTHSKVPREEREKMGISDTLIRLSVGLEDPQDIIDDLDQALSKIESS